MLLVAQFSRDVIRMRDSIKGLNLRSALYPPKSLKMKYSFHKKSLLMQIEGLQRSKEEMQAKFKQELESTKNGKKF